MNIKKLILIALIYPPLSFPQEMAIEGRSESGPVKIVYQMPFVTLQARLQDSNGNNSIDAEEQVILVVIVNNAGPGKAYNLQFRLSTVTSVGFLTLIKNSAGLDLIKPGESKSIEFPINAGFSTNDGQVALRVDVTEKFNVSIPSLDITLNTRAFTAPDLIVTTMGINDGQGPSSYGNNNGKIEKGETIEIKAIIQNRGLGEAGQVTAKIDLDEARLFLIGKKEFALGDLSSGDYREIAFQITVPMNYSGSTQLPVHLRLSEFRGQYGTTAPLNLLLDEALPLAADVRPQQIPFSLQESTNIQIIPSSSTMVDVDSNIPIGVHKRPDAVAVVIGNCDYQMSQVPIVKYALNDASVMREYLIKTLGYDPANIIFWSNATKAQMDATFGNDKEYQGQLFNMIKPNRSEVFIYYSGHGVPDPLTKQAYLVPVDADPAFIRLNGYGLSVLYQNLAKLPANGITVVVDACFSGASESGMLIKNASPILTDVYTPALIATQAVVFTSSSGTQISSWYPEKKHGLFTYYVLKGISGSADSNQDKKISVIELNKYTAEQTLYMARRLHNREQTPVLSPGVEALGPRGANAIVQY